jgi:hypothetical protein
MEPTVRSARIESAIIAAENPAAGNGIFGCRDGRLKAGVKDRKCHRRPNGATIPAKIPTETAYPESA